MGLQRDANAFAKEDGIDCILVSLKLAVLGGKCLSGCQTLGGLQTRVGNYGGSQGMWVQMNAFWWRTVVFFRSSQVILESTTPLNLAKGCARQSDPVSRP